MNQCIDPPSRCHTVDAPVVQELKLGVSEGSGWNVCVFLLPGWASLLLYSQNWSSVNYLSLPT